MNINWKKIVQSYGLLFGGSYLGAFFILVSLNDRFKFPTFPGDIHFLGFYFPFVSSLAIAAFVTAMVEAYHVFKHY